MTLGGFLEKRRGALSQPDVARAIGTTRATVSNWENGHRLPGVEYLDALVDFFELDDHEARQLLRLAAKARADARSRAA